ncbi:MAG TPA: hypothetical protein VK641_13850 [Terriglobales bacterium]|jgi:hypothetical protein|nr:hypothetical protein [Terriglobales bacterium]
MKRIVYARVAGMVLTGMLATLARAQSQPAASQPAQTSAGSSQSLADYARSVRKDKKPAVPKVFDNDNLPKQDKLSVVGNVTEASAATPAGEPSANQSPADPNKPAAIKPEDSPEDRKKIFDEWKGKIDEQKDDISLISRELDVLQREYRLRAAAFYSDAGNRLRDSKDWDTQDMQYKQQIADKQKSVDDARQKLEDLQEQARKAGVPSASRE